MIDVTADNYPSVLNALAGLCGPFLTAASQVDLARMRTLCEQFQALGPVLEPTAYQRGGALNLADQAVFLRALEDFVTTLRPLDRRPACPRCGEGRLARATLNEPAMYSCVHQDLLADLRKDSPAASTPPADQTPGKDTTTVNTEYGPLQVPQDILRIWNRYGWPEPHVLQQMVQTGTVEAAG